MIPFDVIPGERTILENGLNQGGGRLNLAKKRAKISFPTMVIVQKKKKKRGKARTAHDVGEGSVSSTLKNSTCWR